MGNSYHVYADPDGDTARREHVEATPGYSSGQEIVKYLKARLPPTDNVFGEFGNRQPDVKEFDFSRLREPANVPPADGGKDGT